MATIAPTQISFPRQEHVYLPGISYATYDALVTEVGDRRNLRFTYDHGRLEIMSPSHDHEWAKTLFAQMIEAVTEELAIPRLSCGSTTFRDELRDCGLEPDESYYIQHEAAVRGKRIKLGEDPPPDLVLEVDVTTSVIDRLPIYAVMRFPEIWQYIGDEIVVHLLQANGQYEIAEQSLALPMVPLKKLVERFDRNSATDETTWIREFRRWVQGGMK